MNSCPFEVIFAQGSNFAAQEGSRCLKVYLDIFSVSQNEYSVRTSELCDSGRTSQPANAEIVRSAAHRCTYHLGFSGVCNLQSLGRFHCFSHES